MRCPRTQGIICAVWHQFSRLSDLGVIGTASTDAESHSEKPINPLCIGRNGKAKEQQNWTECPHW